MEIFRVENLRFKYPLEEWYAIKNASFTINSGDFCVLFGESGGGKTTLLRLLKPVLAPKGQTEGAVYYKSKNISLLDLKSDASEIGFVFQDIDSQIVCDTVKSELAFSLESLGYSNEEMSLRIAEVCAFFGLEDLMDKKTSELSGGQKQLLNLASVMTLSPEVLLLDEPTSQLDPVSAGNFLSLIKKINTELGTTVIISEHRLEECFSLCDCCIYASNGEIRYFESPNELSSLNEDAAAFLPSSAVIFKLLNEKGSIPLSVKEGRVFLSNYIGNGIISNNRIEKSNKSFEKCFDARDLCFRYSKKSKDAVFNADYTAYNGCFNAILGANGAGKSTFLKLVAGVEKAYSGSIKGAKGKNIFLLGQNVKILFTKETVLQELELSCTDKCKIDKAVKRLRIENLLSRHPYDLSGGEMQKCALAKALLHSPDIILLDEPTKALDAVFKQELGKIINELCESGICVVCVSHDVEFCAKYADVCSLMFGGRLTKSIPANEFFSSKKFYTTSASKISSGFFENAVLCEEVAELCKINKSC